MSRDTFPTAALQRLAGAVLVDAHDK
ncbi:protein of unknown function [Blastococcus saxobsidens DD2]|uniref:Uncharacterized protein n=1 Tax=Blastococcus saxobsidens (strain DD2) TaxID=1146883 RepID=H6RJP3_BLASD|nr:protein of unknown function [Blastococcus saxobsidens DD2]